MRPGDHRGLGQRSEPGLGFWCWKYLVVGFWVLWEGVGSWGGGKKKGDMGNCLDSEARGVHIFRMRIRFVSFSSTKSGRLSPVLPLLSLDFASSRRPDRSRCHVAPPTLSYRRSIKPGPFFPFSFNFFSYQTTQQQQTFHARLPPQPPWSVVSNTRCQWLPSSAPSVRTRRSIELYTTALVQRDCLRTKRTLP